MFEQDSVKNQILTFFSSETKQSLKWSFYEIFFFWKKTKTEKGKLVKSYTPEKSYYKNTVRIKTNFQVKFQHRISKRSSYTNSKKR